MTSTHSTLPGRLPQESGQARRIQAMFGAIAPSYDLLNRLLSCGWDRTWRKALVDALAPQPGERFLDVATGTGDVAREILQRLPAPPLAVLGADFSLPMLKRARAKLSITKGASGAAFTAGAAEALPLPSAVFDGVTVAFGVRNFSDLDRGLAEMARVLKPGGRALILEFSLPRSPALRAIYQLYFNKVLPLVGRWVSGHPRAYRYLPDSVQTFPVREQLARRLETAGFEHVEYRDMTGGIVTLYLANKRPQETRPGAGNG